MSPWHLADQDLALELNAAAQVRYPKGQCAKMLQNGRRFIEVRRSK